MKNIFLGLLLLINLNIKAQEIAQKAFSEGVKFLKSNQYNLAEKQFEIATAEGKSKNGLKMSYIYLAKSQIGLQKYDSAIINFTKSIKIDSMDAASYIDRGLAYAYNKDSKNAILNFKKVLTIDSLGKQAEGSFYYLGRINFSMTKYEKSIEWFDKLIKIAPNDAEAYFLRGTAKSNIMDSDGAILDFDKAIELKPNYMEAYANRGVQKINKLPVKDKIGKKIKCIEDPCRDLLKAKKLGDTSIDDMIYLYCKKCKNKK